MALSDPFAAGWLVLPRLAAGGVLLRAGIQKLQTSFDGQALADTLAGWQAAGHTLSFYQENMVPWVQAHLGLVATLVEVGELAAGVSLVLGLGTRLGAIAGLVLAANYFCASGESINVVMFATHAALLAGAGRALGVDSAIRARMPGWIFG